MSYKLSLSVAVASSRVTSPCTPDSSRKSITTVRFGLVASGEACLMQNNAGKMARNHCAFLLFFEML